MAMGPLMGLHPLATTPRPQVAAVHSSGQSTWQRGSTLLGAVNVQPSSLCVKRCVPVVKAIKSPTQKVASAPVAEPVAEPAAEPRSGPVANEVAPSDLARRWREIGGENDWEGLLDPLDQTLREEILRYGEFVQATYDNFEFDDHSKYCGSARYKKAKMFSEVGLNQTGYEVQRYFYATANVEKPLLDFFKKPPPKRKGEAWSMDSNWMGYIAVATDEKVKQLGRRDIMIAWRGTIRNSEWAANFKHHLSPASPVERLSLKKSGPSIRVETGFLTLYTSWNPKTRYNKTSARKQVLTELKRLLELYKDEELSITICGHSLGSALSTLNAYDIAQLGLNIPGKQAVIPEDWDGHTAPPAMDLPNPKHLKTIPITVFSFAGPRVGNDAFRDRLKDLGVKVLRIVNVNDFVPRVPGLILNENTDHFRWMEKIIDKFPFTYIHVGTELEVNNFHSKDLDPRRAGVGNCHNMEQYLHLIDGHHGTRRNFRLTTGRHLELVNKSCNFLKDEKYVPECWWQRENKGLVFTKDGWQEQNREVEDVPTADARFS